LSPLALLLACNVNAPDTSAFDADTDADPAEGFDLTEDFDLPMTFEGERPSNLLMISLDTTQISRLGRYGGGDVTPNLDALMTAGVTLDDHRSCSNWTFASVLCVNGGAADVELGFVPSISGEGQGGHAPPNQGGMELPDEGLIMAPEVLSALGWGSALISGNPFLSADTNTADGFDSEELVMGGSAEQINAATLEALAYLADGSGEPWFVHAHFMDPHAPYAVPDAYMDEIEALDDIGYDLSNEDGFRALGEDLSSMSDAEREAALEVVGAWYRAELRYFDDHLGELLAAAAAAGYLDDTLVVFWTDHGEELGEHGDMGHDVHMYDELNRSVASFSAPGLAPQSWSAPTQHQDIWPTIFQILGVDPGASFTGPPLGSRDPDAARLGTKHAGDETAQIAVTGDWKLYYSWDGERALYDLASDPGETVDRYDAEPEVAATLWDALLPEVEAVEALRPEYSPVSPGL